MNNAICYVTMYRENVEFLENLFSNYDIDVSVYFAETSDLVDLARELVQIGAKVIISRGGAAAIIKANVPIHVIELKYSYFDFLEPIRRAYKKSASVALLGWYRHIKNFYKYKKELDQRLIYVEFDDLQGTDSQIRVENKIRELIETQKVQVFVGGGGVVEAAKKLGVESEYIALDKNSVLEAVEEAKYYVGIYDEREKRYESINSILNSVFEGVIAIDSHGIITNINFAARKILGIGENYHLNKTCIANFIDDNKIQESISNGEEIVNKIIAFQNIKVILNSTAIKANNIIIGSVITVQEVESIKDLENKIRISAIERGHYAKKNFNDIVGNSPSIQNTKEKARKFALSKSTILILGETGTGKELFAQSIHNASLRKHNPFVAINCAALPESILESELFGYVKGAFTGARAEGKAGVFELAHKGTIFLDEIGEISLKVQTRLLRVLQEKEICRIGDDKVIPVDVRILAATNRDLREEVKKGNFREDLYYRLCVLSLFLIPLRERKEDIPDIIKVLLESIGEERSFTKEAMDVILRQQWEGNVRELSNFVERICVLSKNGTIDEKTVCEALDIRNTEELFRVNTDDRSIRMVDKDYIMKVLEENGGNKKATAKKLGISTTTLWRRIKELE